jgi:hypothetical protein
MRYYFFGDLHGNVDALEACFRHMEAEKADEVFCLGDVAGWLPFGDRTLERMRSTGFPTVAGNHDLLIAGAITDRPEKLDRIQATAYNAGLIFPIPGAVDYLLGLPLSIEKEDFTIVHHSPFTLPSGDLPLTIRTFDYLDDAELEKSIPPWKHYPKRLIFSGHDHIPAVYELTGRGEVRIRHPERNESLSVKLDRTSRYWVKAGSVGGPYRDGVPVANSVLYDSESDTISLFRIPYDASRLREELLAHRFCRNLPTMQKYAALLNPAIS